MCNSVPWTKKVKKVGLTQNSNVVAKKNKLVKSNNQKTQRAWLRVMGYYIENNTKRQKKRFIDTWLLVSWNLTQ